MSTNALDAIVADCGEALGRVGHLFASDSAAKALLARLGWHVSEVPPPLLELGTHLSQITPLITEARSHPDSPEVWASVGEAVIELVSEIRDLRTGNFGRDLDALGFGSELAEQVLQWAAIEQLDRRHPRVLAIMRAVGIVRAIDHPATEGRPRFIEDQFVIPDFAATFTTPSTLLRAAWAWGDPAFDGTGLLEELVGVFRTLGVAAGFVAVPPSPRELEEVATGAMRWHVIARLLNGANAGVGYEAGLRVLNIREGTDPALAFIPYVEGSLAEVVQLGDALELSIAGATTAGESRALLLSPSGIQLVDNLFATAGAAASGEISATVRRRETEVVETKVGPFVLESQGWSVRVAAKAVETTDGELTLEAAVTNAQVGLSVGEDGLLSSLFGSTEAMIPVPLVLGISSRRGVYVGATGLSHDEAISLRLGIVEVNRLSIKLDPVDRGLNASVTTAMSARLGPASLALEGMGVSLSLRFPDSGGNLGVFDLGIDFKPPSGIGVEIDAPSVSGGGFLFRDSERGQYAGVIVLNIHDTLTLTAIGLLATRLPNGAKGFSLVVMITAQGFQPIQLGLGFTLTGIGGLLAINRTCNEEFLREGIKNNTLDDLLFPKDPIRNAAQIFGTLNNAFPPRIGSYFFGPVVQICWGTPPLLTMNLGLILELGNRTRLIILGQVKAILPTEKHDLIRLQMNALGIIDFDQSSISLDAVLYDSRLVGKFPITGGMAMRLRWGSDPTFALSIGGFHPAFKPPANFPSLERLAISFSNSDNFKLRAETYIAITSNTLQLGAKLEMLAKAGGFSIEGRLGFDVLIQFDPFLFLADFYASVQLKRGSHNLFKVKVEGQLSGPRPLHIKGKATFEIFWCDFSVGFDKTLVEGEAPPQLEPVEVMVLLKAALNDTRNWSGQLAEGQRRLVSLRDSPAADRVALHPLGQLSVKQNIVPLELEISKFGNAAPADARLFKINGFTVNGKDIGFSRVRDFFPPSQFLELSDDEKLAAPSFELMMAGLTVGADGFRFTTNSDDLLEDDAMTFETIILDKENNNSRPAPPVSISPQLLIRALSFGAAAQSDVRRTGTARYRPAAGKNSLVKKGWTIASTIDGSAQEAPGHEAGTVGSYAESFQALQKLRQENPAKAKTVLLLRVSMSRN